MTQPDRDPGCTCGPYAPCPIHDDAATQPPADSEPVGPVRIRSANCAAGDHDECASMVEQDVVELGITDCLCACHADGPPADSEGSAEPPLDGLFVEPDPVYWTGYRDGEAAAEARAASPVAESGLREALELIDQHGCQNLTQGRCWDAGRERGARYAADAWCDACIARAALAAAAPPAGGLGPIPMGYTGDLNAEERTGYEFGIRHANEWLAARLASRDQEEGG